MLQLLNSLSLGSGALIVAIASSVLGAVFARVRWPLLRWALVLVVPLALAYSLYWSPLWLSHASAEDYGEFKIWWAVFIIPWYAAGVLSSATVLYVSRRIRRQPDRTEHSQ